MDQTCNNDTIPGAQYISLHSPIDSTKPTYRRITFDIGNDFSGFGLESFHVSTKPLRKGDFATIIACGWSVADQYREGIPTWCEYIKLEGTKPFLQKVTVDRSDVAYMVIGGVLNYTPPPPGGEARASKGNKPVEFQLEDISVCVPK